MANESNQHPVIIKRKKVVAGDGHHGGAWKVAYADFVTAMMAFFMLMWLLNATTEQQRKGIADYFSPSIPITRISGGGDGSFGGDSVFSETTAAQNGTGATSLRPTEGRQALGLRGSDHRSESEARSFETISGAVLAGRGDSMLRDLALRHVQTRLTDEGLVIEIHARPDAPLFEEGAGLPSPWLAALVNVMGELFSSVSNRISVSAHVASEPVVVARDSRWDLSLRRAQAVRRLLEESGVPSARIARVTGHADRDPVMDAAPMDTRNNRVAVTLLRNHP